MILSSLDSQGLNPLQFKHFGDKTDSDAQILVKRELSIKPLTDDQSLDLLIYMCNREITSMELDPSTTSLPLLQRIKNEKLFKEC